MPKRGMPVELDAASAPAVGVGAGCPERRGRRYLAPTKLVIAASAPVELHAADGEHRPGDGGHGGREARAGR